MRPIDERIVSTFEENKRKNPAWSDALCFAHTITGKGLKFADLRRLFDGLVDKHDYARCEKEEVLQDMYRKTLLGWE